MKSYVRTALLWAGALALIGGAAYVSQHFWKEHGLRLVQAINAQRILITKAAVRAEVNRQDHLPLLLSLDAEVRRVLTSGDPAGAENLARKLKRISVEADTRAVYVIRADGLVLASDDWQEPDTRVGQNLADRVYFKRTMEAGKSAILDVEPETGRIRYYLAEAVRDGPIVGMVVVRIEFDALESSWERAGEHIVVTDRNGIVFLSSDPSYKFRFLELARGAASAAARPDDRLDVRQPPLSWEVLEQRGESAVVRDSDVGRGASYLYASVALPEYGWTVHQFTDLASVNNDQRDGAIIGAALSALFLSLLLYMLQRHRAYLYARDAGLKLKREVEDRTQELRDANVSLQGEVDERRRTEARLRATQNELVQAGKLAALGRMSAALAHELNQPLAAIQTFIASTRIFAQRGDVDQVTRNIDLISDLADRMARLSAHLKTFARKSEPGHRERVRIDRILDGALFLVDSRIRSGAVEVGKDVEPGLVVVGHAVQLEQVMVNLLMNALDAVAGVAQPRVAISARNAQEAVVIEVADNGTGIPDELTERIFDPFVTTKPVGKGLGLGLSISYGIVQDFQGRIYAANLPGGGAVVTVELPHSVEAAPSIVEASHA